MQWDVVEAAPGQLLGRYRAVRARTLALIQPLSAEDCVVQSMPDASPAKWHLAHTTWFFETFVLGARPAHRPFHPQYSYLYNSYYEAVGARHARPMRGLLTRPSLDEVRAYRAHVDRAVEEALASGELAPETLRVLALGLAHEEQHQELLVTDVKHLLAANPLDPAYLRLARVEAPRPGALAFVPFEAGLREIGHAGLGFAFDNEGPRHRVFAGAFELASRATTNAEYLEFVEGGGYSDARWWLSDGWDWVRREGVEAPLYWRRDPSGWSAFTLGGRLPLEPDEPVTHLSLYEADAYARFRGARLPTEVEWEIAAQDRAVEGRFADPRRLHPLPAPPLGEDGLAALFGDVWEWTSSAYAPYPGFRAAPGALGEYNGKFMCNQVVLRGGSCATPPGHVRATYRNFFHADARWQFSGVRLARDVR